MTHPVLKSAPGWVPCAWPRCTTLVRKTVATCQVHRWHRAMELDRMWGDS